MIFCPILLFCRRRRPFFVYNQFLFEILVDTHTDTADTFMALSKVLTTPAYQEVRMQISIIQDLPDKIQIDEYCTLTTEQAAIYQNIVEQTMETIESSEGIERKGLVLKLILTLKQICNHPCNYLKSGKRGLDREFKTDRQQTGTLQPLRQARRNLDYRNVE